MGSDVSTGYAVSATKTDLKIVHVEPNYYGEFLSEPSDPYFDQQWYLDDIDAPEAWDRSLGEGVLIALIDSGVDLGHEDLAANLLPDGFDFGDNDDDPSDQLGHGTMVCGIIAALSNNGLGISGVAPVCKILPLKVNQEDKPTIEAAAAAEAIIYAADREVKIINLSLGWLDEEPLIVKEAITYAVERGVLLIAAAGQDNGGPARFPASLPEVIAVSATDENSEFCTRSNCGFTSNQGPEIELSAPGVNIYTTNMYDNYTISKGTSFSAPIVSAVAALLAARHPHLSSEGIREVLISRADDLGEDGRDDKFGYGKVNAHKSLDVITAAVPGTLYSSKSIPLVYLLAVLGDGTGFSPFSSEVSFESTQITPLGPPLVLFPSLLFQLTLLENSATEGVSSISVTTESETFSGFNLLSIAPLPWNL
jgi:subtilisin family serine protease